MYGLEAINTHNGWAISVVGITIVFSGLVSLSLVISQLHKVLALYEDPSKIKAFFEKKQVVVDDDDPEPVADIVLTQNQKELVKQFALLARTMEDHFSLPRLLNLASISGLKDPHQNLNILLKLRIVKPDGDGFFTWEKDRFDQALDK